MPVQTQCTVAEAVRLNDFACSLTLDVGEEMAGQIACGQFVHIKCGHSRLLRRPISICDWQENLLRVVFEVRGEGTEWLARRKAGDRLDVLGPLGHGFDVAAGSLLVVGGGIGAPPMLGCAKYAASRGSEVHAVLGFRDAGHKMLTEDFAECCRFFRLSDRILHIFFMYRALFFLLPKPLIFFRLLCSLPRRFFFLFCTDSCHNCSLCFKYKMSAFHDLYRERPEIC